MMRANTLPETSKTTNLLFHTTSRWEYNVRQKTLNLQLCLKPAKTRFCRSGKDRRREISFVCELFWEKDKDGASPTVCWSAQWQRCWRRGDGSLWRSWFSSERRCSWSNAPGCPGCAGTNALMWWSQKWPVEWPHTYKVCVNAKNFDLQHVVYLLFSLHFKEETLHLWLSGLLFVLGTHFPFF